MKSIIISALFTLFFIQNSFAQPQKGRGDRADRVKALWVAYVTQELNLTPDESAKFWPVYNEYKEKERQLNREKRQNGNADPASMRESEIDRFFNQSMTAEEKIISLKREYYPKFKSSIPASKVIRLPELEREFKKKIIKIMQERRRGQ